MANRSSSLKTHDIRQCEPTSPQVGVVLLKRYCELTGDTADAVHSRRARGDWIDGVHCCLVDGRRLWIDLKEVETWVRNGGRLL